jgi:hypothetical protein
MVKMIKPGATTDTPQLTRRVTGEHPEASVL